MITRTYGGYSLLLLPALLAMGCSDSSSSKLDAARYDSSPGLIDSSSDRGGDLPATPDGLADARPDVPVGPDAGVVDTAGVELGVGPEAGADLRVDGARDVATDVAADSRDAAGVDVAPRDVPALDTGSVDVATADLAVTEAGAIDAGPLAFVATLTGGQVVPPVTTPTTADASFQLSTDRTQLIYRITQSVADVTTVAIYAGAAGSNGAQVFSLTPVGADMSGSVTLTPAQVTSLEQGLMYVLISSTANPNGLLRGQILRPSEALFVASLTGAQEVPAVVSTATAQGGQIAKQ